MNYKILLRIVEECEKMGGKKDLDLYELADNLDMHINELGRYITVNPDERFIMPDKKTIDEIRKKQTMNDIVTDKNYEDEALKQEKIKLIMALRKTSDF